MIRLAITVEGGTEEGFVKDVLASDLSRKGIYAFPILLGRSARRVRVGGNVTIARLAADMVSNYHRFDFVTSLVDFCGFRDKGTRSVGELEQAITQEVDRRLRPNWDRRKIVPYVQRHEFEGLLFSQVNAFDSVPGADHAALQQLQSIRAQFSSPEDINDGSNTAPSKRIEQLFTSYNKRVNGPQIAQVIGISTIRAQCPRFNEWVTWLESLAVCHNRTL